jgi:hypothetical protein
VNAMWKFAAGVLAVSFAVHLAVMLLAPLLPWLLIGLGVASLVRWWWRRRWYW